MRTSYNNWLDEVSLDDKVILEKFTENEIIESFTTELQFGTGGARATMGLGTNKFNNYSIANLTKALCEVLKSTENPSVVIGYDNRNNSYAYAIVAAEVCSSFGIKAILFDELIATPLVSFTIRQFNATAGIIITASHNPKEYNGYKLYNQDGCQLLPHEIKPIIENFDNSKIFNYESDESKIERVTMEDIPEYFYNLYEICRPYVKSQNSLKIGFSNQHGTSLKPAEKIFTDFSFDYKLVKEQVSFDGNFPNTKSPNPEDKVAYEKLIELGKENSLDLLLTTDPDADRVGVMCKHNDEYVLLNGNEVATVMLKFIIDNTELNNNYIATTVVSSELPVKIAEANNIDVVKKLTGFKYIGDAIAKTDKNFLFGYEESFGYLFSDMVRDKDAIQSLLLITIIANELKENGQTLVDKLEDIHAEFGYYKEDLLNFFTSKEINFEVLKREIIATLKPNYLIDFNDLTKTNLSNGEVNKFDFDTENLIQFESDNFIISLRKSGTEPKTKIYISVNSSNKLETIDLLTNCTKEITEIFNKYI